MTETYTLQNTITGMTYSLDKEICDKLVVEEPETFKVVDKTYVEPEKEVIDNRSTFEKVVVSTPSLEKLTVEELKYMCNVRSIEYKKNSKKAELIELINGYNNK